MGYEVLDSRGEGGPGPAPAGTTGDLEVVDLGSEQVGDQPRGLPRLLGAEHGGANRARRAAQVAALVFASLAAGGAVGGFVVRRHEQSQQRQAQRAVFAADAVISDVSSAGSGDPPRAVVTARFTNHGQLPVRVATDAASQPVGTTVYVVSRTPVVPAGATVLVSVTLPVTCNQQGLPLKALLSVRTADGRLHRLALESTALGGGSSLEQVACQGSAADATRVVLHGPISRPLLQLTNQAGQNVRFTITSDGGAGTLNGERLVTVATIPALPIVLRGGAGVELRLLVSARRCPLDLADIQSGAYLQVEGVATTGSGRFTAGADISGLVGAAIARACAH